MLMSGQRTGSDYDHSLRRVQCDANALRVGGDRDRDFAQNSRRPGCPGGVSVSSAVFCSFWPRPVPQRMACAQLFPVGHSGMSGRGVP
jgi:hypothetical protein